MEFSRLLGFSSPFGCALYSSSQVIDRMVDCSKQVRIRLNWAGLNLLTEFDKLLELFFVGRCWPLWCRLLLGDDGIRHGCPSPWHIR